MSHAMLLESLDTGGVWSIARGLARNEDTYKGQLMACDATRRNAEALLPHVNWSGSAAFLARAQFQRYGEYLVDAVRLDELTPAQCFEAVAAVRR